MHFALFRKSVCLAWKKLEQWETGERLTPVKKIELRASLEKSRLKDE